MFKVKERKEHKEVSESLIESDTNVNQLVPKTEATRLIDIPLQLSADEQLKFKRILWEILSGTSSFGIRSLFVATHYTGNGLIMSYLGPDAAAASSITTSGVAFVTGMTTGFTAATGIGLAVALGKKDNQTASSVIKTSWAMSSLLGALSAGALLSTKVFFPLFLNQGVANAATEFFTTYAVGTIPELLMWSNGQTVFQIEKNTWVPIVTTATYRLPALALSYYFSKSLGLGPKGVGLGAAVSGWANVILFQPWFFKEIYRKLGLYNKGIPNFKKHVKGFMKSGWPIALQRTTEWSNLFAIAQITGAWSSEKLLAEQVSMLLLVSSGLITQGYGQGSMMMVTRDRTAMKKELEKFYDTEDFTHFLNARRLKEKNYKHFFIANLGGNLFSLLLAGTIYLGRKPIIHWYTPPEKEIDNSIIDLATTLLLINGISLPFDAVRNITAGILRGWNDLLFPTLVSLVMMTMIGVPAGAVIDAEFFAHSVAAYFIARIVALVISSGINVYRFFIHNREDEYAQQHALFFKELIEKIDEYENAVVFSSKTILENKDKQKIIDISPINEQLALKENITQYELRIIEEENNSFFHLVSRTLEDRGDCRQIRNLVSQHVKDNIIFYEQQANVDRAIFLDNIARGEISDEHILVQATSRALNTTIVIITSHINSLRITKQPGEDLICLGYQPDYHFYRLQGNPNMKLLEQVQSVKIDNFRNTEVSEKAKFCGWLFNSKSSSWLEDNKEHSQRPIVVSDVDEERGETRNVREWQRCTL